MRVFWSAHAALRVQPGLPGVLGSRGLPLAYTWWRPASSAIMIVLDDPSVMSANLALPCTKPFTGPPYIPKTPNAPDSPPGLCGAQFAQKLGFKPRTTA